MVAHHGARPAMLVSSVDGTARCPHRLLLLVSTALAAAMESVTVAFDPRAAVIRHPDLEAVEAGPQRLPFEHHSRPAGRPPATPRGAGTHGLPATRPAIPGRRPGRAGPARRRGC